VLIRGVGPGLAQLGIQNSLGDPLLRLFDHRGALLASNDNWSAVVPLGNLIAATAAQVGAFKLSSPSNDSAILVSLAPGNYTVHLVAAGASSGLALIEVYDVP